MPRILVVEDDSMNMRLAQHVLEAQGYTVMGATTARQALERIESTPFDLILMDIHLPDMDGTTIVRLLRENAATRDITIVALTACAMKGNRERILQMGCDGYISKPINIRDFVNTVRGFLIKNENGAGH